MRPVTRTHERSQSLPHAQVCPDLRRLALAKVTESGLAVGGEGHALAPSWRIGGRIAEIKGELWGGRRGRPGRPAPLAGYTRNDQACLSRSGGGKNMQEPLPYLNQQSVQTGSWKRNYPNSIRQILTLSNSRAEFHDAPPEERAARSRRIDAPWGIDRMRTCVLY